MLLFLSVVMMMMVKDSFHVSNTIPLCWKKIGVGHLTILANMEVMTKA